MLTFEQMTELIELVASHRLGSIEIERSGFRFRIDGRSVVESPKAAVVSPLEEATTVVVGPEVASPAAPQAVPEAKAAAPVDEGHVLTSPIVGTFYASPQPGSPSFVDVGSRVKKGQVLCIVEAMKLMNEIESDANGVITKIFPQNAQPVEFGEPLFAIKAD